ncbi:hypothetical protein TOPH_02859 [Tolypocladium ophioglossoides CBS 100239]|uniref:Uncharacterized protein n=1 Tax=Tolypocladium ophioglossoides (strain CBS 100239) TaxID=1163406 RepID=A0A0L0NEH3_TOLOC|nr:hypothetical protein TOPH_02859 [Tolypocladium ophioglossoides CBS 100239]
MRLDERVARLGIERNVSYVSEHLRRQAARERLVVQQVHRLGLEQRRQLRPQRRLRHLQPVDVLAVRLLAVLVRELHVLHPLLLFVFPSKLGPVELWRGFFLQERHVRDPGVRLLLLRPLLLALRNLLARPFVPALLAGLGRAEGRVSGVVDDLALFQEFVPGTVGVDVEVVEQVLEEELCVLFGEGHALGAFGPAVRVSVVVVAWLEPVLVAHELQLRRNIRFRELDRAVLHVLSGSVVCPLPLRGMLSITSILVVSHLDLFVLGAISRVRIVIVRLRLLRFILVLLGHRLGSILFTRGLVAYPRLVQLQDARHQRLGYAPVAGVLDGVVDEAPRVLCVDEDPRLAARDRLFSPGLVYGLRPRSSIETTSSTPSTVATAMMRLGLRVELRQIGIGDVGVGEVRDIRVGRICGRWSGGRLRDRKAGAFAWPVGALCSVQPGGRGVAAAAAAADGLYVDFSMLP